MDHSPADKENPNLSGLLAIDCPWHKVVTQLQNISQIMTWGDISVEKNRLTSAIIQAFKRCRSDSACKDCDWLLLSDELKAVNKQRLSVRASTFLQCYCLQRDPYSPAVEEYTAEELKRQLNALLD